MVVKEKHNILVFSNDNSMQNILSEVLISDRFQLEFLPKGNLSKPYVFNPNLVLLDHSSAPLSAEENSCEKIKTFFPAIPLVVLSAYPLNNFDSYTKHMDLFIAKPFDLSYFLGCIDSYCY